MKKNDLVNSHSKFLQKLCYIFILFLNTIGFVFAQDHLDISGKITDIQGEALPGVNVVVKGSTRGTLTDVEGYFELKKVPVTSNLLFTYIGYKSIERTLGSQTSFSITMEEDIAALETIVVVGYGQTQNTKEISTSITKVTPAQIEGLQMYDATQALQGVAPGVVVAQESGSPGAPLTVRVRGIGSSNNANPLYLVDGVQVPNTDFLNPSDIADVSVLKDAASSAIYGSRGGNGVVMIQTKSGKRNMQNPKISISGYYGVQTLGNKPDLMNRDEYIDFYNRSVDYYSVYDPGNVPARGKITSEEAALLPDTDWYDEVFEETPLSNLYLSLQDGKEDYSYALSAGIYQQDGMVGGKQNKSNFKRLSLRGSFEKDLFRGFNVTIGGSIVQTDRNFLNENTPQTGAATLNYINTLPPVFPAYAPNGEIFNPGRLNPVPDVNGVDLFALGAVTNPFVALQLTNQNAVTNIKATHLGASYEIAAFKFSTNFAYYGTRRFNKNFTPTYRYTEQGLANTISSLTEATTDFSRTQWNNTVSYDLPATDDTHALQVLLGTSVLQERMETGSKTGSNFYVNTFEEVNFALMQDPSQIIVHTPGITETGLLSFFGRVNYAYKEKYLLGATFRADASSRFSQSNRTGYFPSVSVGWNISEEDFMQQAGFLDLLKLRASWGINGNDNIAPYQYEPQITTDARYVDGSGGQTLGLAPFVLANPDVKWEEVAQINVGLDANLFNNRLGITVDYYVKKTTDMLAPVGTPDLVGQGTPFKNIADVENKGLEVLINHKNRVSEDFEYNIQVNLNHFTNKITSLGAEGTPVNSGFVAPAWAAPISKTDNGQAIAGFYGYEVAGLDGQGDFIFKDNNGDGEVTADDKTFIGNPFPDLIYGLSAGATYKNFDIDLRFFGNHGNDIYKAFIRHDAPFLNKPVAYLNSWTPTNTDTDIPRSALLGVGTSQQNEVSDFYVEDGSFLKLRTITLGYTLPKSISNAVKASKIRFYVTAQNLFVFTRYSGVDPEIGQAQSASFLDVGIDRGFYPQPRVFLGGFQIDLF